ncbi:MAG: GNAT family N-acetyltransferase [Lentisphaerae bacterium]|nr:GNAT family N-acetyltransferase [Lentisphaerota bacterium]
MKALSSYRIRNAGFEDAGAIYALIKEHPREVVPRAISDIVQNIDRFLVCEAKARSAAGRPACNAMRSIAGRIIGTAAWQVLPEIGKARNPSIEIKSVAVSGRYRRRGIGSALVKATIQRIKRFHPAQLVVLTFTPAFFHQFGFREVPKETLMHKLYMGCINCTKYDSPFTCPEVAMTLAVKPR